MRMTKVKVASKEDLKMHPLMGIEIRERRILLARVKDEYFAMDGLCGHANGRLWDGTIEGYIVTCPKHGSQYDVRTGRAVKGPWIPLAKAKDRDTYPVTLDGEDVFIEI